MLRNVIGHETFRKAINTFLKEKAYATAKTNQLWDYLQAAVDRDNASLPQGHTVKEVMDNWVSLPGAPVVTLTRNDDGTAALSQVY
jgi:aminopeptidase N